MENIAWMAWTPPTAIFFALLAMTLATMTVLAVKYPEAERIGILRIPRLGGDYAQEIGEGVSERTVLNTRIGHFPGTAAAGEVGNFALAGHRTSHHAPLLRINELVVGDEILVETATSNIVYKFRSLEYVSASAIDVTWPTPRSESPATTGTITFVACNPLRSTAERIIVYGVLDRVTPK